MKNKTKPARRALSVLLSMLMVITALPLVSFNASAAPDYGTLGTKLGLIEDLRITSESSPNCFINSSVASSGSGLGNYRNTTVTASAVSDGGQPVWDAFELYAAAVGDIYDNSRTPWGTVNCGWAANSGKPRGDRTYSTTQTPANNTATWIRNTINTGTGGGHSSILQYFGGNFRLDSGYDNTGLLDIPSASCRKTTTFDTDWVIGWARSNGQFTVNRLAKDAMLNSGITNLNSMPASVNTSLSMLYQHEFYWGPEMQGETVDIIYRWRYSMCYHELSAKPAPSYSATNIAAITNALKAWRDDVDWEAELEDMNYGELAALRNAYDTAKERLDTTPLATNAPGDPSYVDTAVNRYLSHSYNADVLAFYHLPSIADGAAYRNKINAMMAVRLYEDYAMWFHDPASGKMTTAPANCFNSAANVGDVDPNGLYNGMSYEDLEDFLYVGGQKHAALVLNSADAEVWDKLLELMDTDQDILALEAAWLRNIQRVIYIWDLLALRTQVARFLDEEAIDLHVGVNPNDTETNPFDEDNELEPDDPANPYGDSQYLHDNQAIATFIERAAGYLGSLAAISGAGYDDLVAELFRAYGARNLQQELTNRQTTLHEEKAYRWESWHSEDYWYSYRDFFTPLYFRDFGAMSAEALMAFFQDDTANAIAGADIEGNPRVAAMPGYIGVWPNWVKYQAMSDACLAALGQEAWEEIYGGYAQDVILPAIDKIYKRLAAELTVKIDQAMKLVYSAEAENLIELDAAGATRHGTMKVLSWGTFGKIKKAIDLLNHWEAGDPVENKGKDIYLFLDHYLALGFLGYEGPPSYAATPSDYSSGYVREDYKFLLEEVLSVYKKFMAKPGDYVKQTKLPPVARNVRSDDILPGHRYADVRDQATYWAWVAPPPWKHISRDDPDFITDTGDAEYIPTDDPALNTLIDRLDSMIGANGDLSPLLALLDIGIDPADLGLPAGAELNVSNLVDGMMSSLLFNDKMLNTIVGALFPMLLDQLEDVFDTMLPEMIDNLDYSDLSVDLLGILTVNLQKLKLYPNHLYKILTDDFDAPQADTEAVHMNRIKLYPNQLASCISATQFGVARGQLLAANNGGGNSWANKSYPTKAWKASSLYRPNPETGEQEFWLDWGIKNEQDFRDALTQVFSGLWPLLKALLAGGGQTVKLQAGGVGKVDVTTNIISPTGMKVDLLALGVSGLDGYSQLLTPILECLLGTDTTKIPSLETVRGYTLDSYAKGSPVTGVQAGAKSLVDAIVDPLMEYIGRVKAAPISEVLKLLPNLCYAFSLDRVLPLLDNLKLSLSVAVDGEILEINNPIYGVPLIGFGPPSWHLSIADFMSGGIRLDDVTQLDLSDLLKGPNSTLGLKELLTIDGLLDMVFGLFSEDKIELPLPPNPGRIATYGKIDTYTSKRWPAGSTERRHYIMANRADVMQALLQYLLGAGFLQDLLNKPLNTDDLSEAVAAIAELVLPQPYPVTPVTCGPPAVVAPADVPYPAWWAGLEPDGAVKAKLDGQYIAANADLLMDVLWGVLNPDSPSFTAGLKALLNETFVSAATLEMLVGEVHGLLSGLLGGESATAANVLNLVSAWGMIGGVNLDLEGILNELNEYTVGPVNSIEDFIDELVSFLAPLTPVLDFLLYGADIDLVDIGDGDGTGLLKALGGEGFVNGLKPLVEAFTKPLGLGTVALPATGSASVKLHALLDPLADVYNAILARPVSGLLTLLPNLAYFLAEPLPPEEPDPLWIGEGPLQQCLNNLLHPLYVLIDTLRPITDASALLTDNIDLPGWLTLNPGEKLKVHMPVFDLKITEQVTGRLDMARFLLGALDEETGTYLVADKAAVLFTLMDSFGLLQLIQDMGMEGVTKLIQYKQYPEPDKIDYAAAPGRAQDAQDVPGWFRPTHAQYLADNADAVLAYAWGELLNMNVTSGSPPTTTQPLKELLQGELDKNNIGITLGNSLPDTVGTLWSNEPYVKENLFKLVDMALGLRDTLDGIEIPALVLQGVNLGGPVTLTQALAALVSVYDESRPMEDPIPLDLNVLMAGLDALYEGNAVYDAYIAAYKADWIANNSLAAFTVDYVDAYLAQFKAGKINDYIAGFIEDFVTGYLAAHPGETAAAQAEANAAARTAAVKEAARLAAETAAGPLDLTAVKAEAAEAHAAAAERAALAARAGARAAAMEDSETLAADLLEDIEDEESFKAALLALFSPLMPVLRVFLAQSNVLLIRDPANPFSLTDPAVIASGDADDGAFLRAYGYNGYEGGLLPILLGLGADVPGFIDELEPYSVFRAAGEEEQLLMILEPILYLLNTLADNPVHTLLQVLPNAARFVSDNVAEGKKSLLRQALDNLLFPLTVLFGQLAPAPVARPEDEEAPDYGEQLAAYEAYLEKYERFAAGPLGATTGLLDKVTGLKAGELVNAWLLKTLGGLEDWNAFEIEQLIIGTIQLFSELDSDYADFDDLGLSPGAKYVETDLPKLLTKLLSISGAFAYIDKEGFAGLVELLNVSDRITVPGPAPIDYSQAPPEAAVGTLAWLTGDQAAFLLENLDGVLNWFWRELVFAQVEGETPVKDALEAKLAQWLEKPVTLNTTWQGTVNDILGGYLYTQENFDLIVGSLAGLQKDLAGVDVGGLPLPLLIEKLVLAGSTPLNLAAMFSPLVAHATALEPEGDPAAYIEITGQADFVEELTTLLLPFAPLLRVLLTEAQLRVINSTDPSVNGGNGFLVIDGSNGYETGLLPLLMGLGASVPGYLDTLKPYLDDEENEIDGVKGGSDAYLLQAILAPLLHLLGKVAEDPIHTLMQVLPNAAYLLGGNDSTSLLQQAVNNLLHPLYAALEALPASLLADEQGKPLVPDLSNLGLGGKVNTALAKLLGQIGLEAPFSLNDLVVGKITNFGNFDGEDPAPGRADLAALGVKGRCAEGACEEPWPCEAHANGASFVAADEGQLLLQLLNLFRSLIPLDDDTLAGIAGLLNTDPLAPRPAADWIDYAQAPAGQTFAFAPAPNAPYNWLRREHAQFLVENADGVLNWAWARLLSENTDAQTGLIEGVTLGDSVLETVQDLLGTYLYTVDNLGEIVKALQGLRARLEDPENPRPVLGLMLSEALEKAVQIGGAPLNLGALFTRLDEYTPPAEPVTPGVFKAKLVYLLEPLVPLLRVLLTESDLMAIVDDDVVDGDGLVKVPGSNGYETGLLPLLMALGANVPGYLDTLKPYLDDEENGIDGVRDGSDAYLLDAILDPILFLLGRLVEQPVQTLLQVLPSAAYFISEANGKPLLQQAVDNILFALGPVVQKVPQVYDLLFSPESEINLSDLGVAGQVNGFMEKTGLTLDDLVAGTVKVFEDPALARLGVKGRCTENCEEPCTVHLDKASYLETDQASLLALILDKIISNDKTLLQQMNDSGFAGLVNLLNTPCRPGKDDLGPIVYPAVNTAANLNALYKGCLWKRKDAVKMSNRTGEFVDNIWIILTGSPFNTTFEGLLGNSLYTQKNFEGIVGGLQTELAKLDLDQPLGPIANRTLRDLLVEVATLDGGPLDVLYILGELQGFEQDSGVDIETQEGFVSELTRFLLPAAPLLDFLFFGKDITLLGGLDDVNGGGGLITAYGYDGYQFGLIPIYEALLMPLGAQGEIAYPSDFDGMEPDEKIAALLHPILFAAEKIIANPLENLLKVLPNLAYLVNKNAGGSSLLQESLDLSLYAVTSVLGSVTGETKPLFELDVGKLLDDLLKPMGINGLDSGLLNRLRLGTPTDYNSISGGNGIYLSLATAEDRADLLTAILRTVVDLIQGDKANREKLVTLITDAIIPSGFGHTSLHWGIHYVLWSFRLFGTNFTLRKTFCLLKLMSFFMPFILWVQRIFNGLFR